MLAIWFHLPCQTSKIILELLLAFKSYLIAVWTFNLPWLTTRRGWHSNFTCNCAKWFPRLVISSRFKSLCGLNIVPSARTPGVNVKGIADTVDISYMVIGYMVKSVIWSTLTHMRGVLYFRIQGWAKKGPQVARIFQASWDRNGKQQQEQNSPNLGPTF